MDNLLILNSESHAYPFEPDCQVVVNILAKDRHAGKCKRKSRILKKTYLRKVKKVFDSPEIVAVRPLFSINSSFIDLQQEQKMEASKVKGGISFISKR